MNTTSDMSNVTMTEKKTASFFNFISLATFTEYAKTRIDDFMVSNLILALKFSDVVDRGDYKYYNFHLGGIYDKTGCIDYRFPDLARVKGISFSEKRGEFLLRTFNDSPFYIFQIRPLSTGLSMDNFYYTFKTSRVGEMDIPVVERNIEGRLALVAQGSIAVDDSFKFSLSK